MKNLENAMKILIIFSVFTPNPGDNYIKSKQSGQKVQIVAITFF